jgi:hypothetical protein
VEETDMKGDEFTPCEKTDQTEASRCPELYLVTVQEASNADILEFDREGVRSPVKLDALVDSGTIPDRAIKCVANCLGRCHDVEDGSRFSQIGILGEMETEQTVSQSFRCEPQELNLAADGHPGIRFAQEVFRHAGISEQTYDVGSRLNDTLGGEPGQYSGRSWELSAVLSCRISCRTLWHRSVLWQAQIFSLSAGTDKTGCCDKA